jgi:hypothetical protein
MQDILVWLPGVLIILAILLIRMLPGRVFLVVRPTSGVVVVILIGTILLLWPSQGRELVNGISDSPSQRCALGINPEWCRTFFFISGVLFWSQLSRFSAQIALANSDIGRRDNAWFIYWLPYVYQHAVFAIAAISLLFSLGRSINMQIVISLVVIIVLIASNLFLEWKNAQCAVERIAATEPAEEQVVEKLWKYWDPWQIGSLLVVLYLLFTQASWTPVELSYEMGSLAIALFALGVWTLIAAIITIVQEKIRSKFHALTSLFILLMTIIIVNGLYADDFHRVDTFWDDDAARLKMSLERVRERPTVAEEARRFGKQATSKGGQSAPIVFVATAGGGIRAAYWTAVALGHLSDRLPSFPDRLFAISGVSGGSLGAVLIQALIAREDPLPRGFESTAKSLLQQDFLGPTILRMAFTELVMPLSHVVGFSDRGKALELGWSASWSSTFEGSDNPLDDPFMDLWGNNPQERWRPVLLLNATHEEQGKRIITSNVRVTEGPFVDAWDMHQLLGGRDLPLSTAAHNSARFSWVSPAGTIIGSDGRSRGHVVDGGYFENYGAVTILEIARAALLELRDRKLLPIIIQISSDPELSARDQPRGTESSGCKTEGSFLPFDLEHDPKSVWGFYNDALAPIGGIYATRSGRGILAAKELATWAECWAEDELEVRPIFVHLAMCSEARPPLGWVMTQESRDGIDDLLSEDGCNSGELAKLTQAWSKFQ